MVAAAAAGAGSAANRAIEIDDEAGLCHSPILLYRLVNGGRGRDGERDGDQCATLPSRNG